MSQIEVGALLEPVPSIDINMNATQEKMLSLLGGGYPPSVVASSLGVSESYVSQMMSLDWFASQVQEIKFLNLRKHTELDDRYDDLEDKLLTKLDKLIPLLVRPMDVTRVLQTVNNAKRKGAGSQGPGLVQNNIIQLSLPPALLQRFTANVHNQIVEVHNGTGQQNSIVTTSSGSLERLSREAKEARALEHSISESVRDELIRSSEGAKHFSPEELAELADPKAIKARLNESGRTTPAIAADDL